MPFYEIQHIIPLTDAQQDELAEAITHIHSTMFTTPRLFVNVKFTDYSKVTTFVGGKRQQGNHIIANVRTGPSRTQADWDKLCADVVAAWNGIVPMPKVRRGEQDRDDTLRSCIILGGLTAGYEAGFSLPPAGGDVAWMKKNLDAFQKKADGGDQEFKGMIEEIQRRGLLNQANGDAK